MRRLADSRALGQRDQSSREPGHQVDAREAGPLAVRLQQRSGLVALDPAALERDRELDQTEVADEPELSPPEAFEADDADRPRAEPALALEALGDHRRGELLEAFELDRAAYPRERRAAPRVQAERAQLGGRGARERRAVGRSVQVADGS